MDEIQVLKNKLEIAIAGLQAIVDSEMNAIAKKTLQEIEDCE
tara:strand:+ start:256 stop:381 length:126 start_codon:yes stop_codon:yes gene_type:complete